MTYVLSNCQEETGSKVDLIVIHVPSQLTLMVTVLLKTWSILIVERKGTSAELKVVRKKKDRNGQRKQRRRKERNKRRDRRHQRLRK